MTGILWFADWLAAVATARVLQSKSRPLARTHLLNLKPKYAPTPSLKRRMHRAGPDNPEPSCKDPVAEFQMLERCFWLFSNRVLLVARL